jgi:hypothetical protein
MSPSQIKARSKGGVATKETEYGEQIKGGGLVPAPKGDVMTTNIITGAGTYNQVFWAIKLLALVAGEKTLGELSGQR